MSNRSPLLLCALAGLLCWSCNDDAEPLTQVVVIVRSDLDIGAQLTHLRLDLSDPDGEREIHRGELIPLVEDDPEPGEQTLPMSFGIVPEGGDASLRFLLKVRGYGPLGENGTDIEIVRESVLTGFLPGETTVIQVFLGKQCLQNLCESQGGGTLMSCDYRSGTCGEIVFVPPVRVTGEPGLVGAGCGTGFKQRGDDCIDIDECETDDAMCGEGARCENTSGGYQCVCEDDSIVEHEDDCDLDNPVPPGACEEDPCEAPGECSDEGDDFLCTCPSGYEVNDPGVTSCTDIDECQLELDECDPLATCVNEVGGYRCEDCPAGYEDPEPGDTECADIDECEADTDECDPRALCVNEPGGYRCEDCPEGLTDPEPGDTECINIDECELGTDDCDPGLSCADTDGSFQCMGCPAGFVDPEPGDTACTDIDECELNTDGCDAIATCENTEGSFQCNCPSTHSDPAEGETDCIPMTDGCVVRVSTAGNDANDGSSWALAKATLHGALDVAGVCEVWVAQGTYVPSRNAANEASSGRDATFQLRANVPVYGGFVATEDARDQRNYLAHPTILSGNIGAAGASDNVYHVVTGANGATLDGFFVRDGYAQEGGAAVNDLRNQGGGMFNSALDGGITIDHVVFVANRANFGGGLANRFGTAFEVDSSVFLWNHGVNGGGGLSASAMVSTTDFTTGSVTSSTFFGNSGTYGVAAWSSQALLEVRDSTFQANVTAATQSSGALDFSNSPPSGTKPHSAINCTFIGNTGVKGAALWVDSNQPNIIGCSFINNVSDTSAAIATRELSPPARPQLLNCLFWNNTRQASALDVSAEEGGSPFADASCARQNLDGFGDGNANVVLDPSPSPLGTILPSGVAYLNQTATAPTCLNAASTVHATTAMIPWSTLTTAASGTEDAGSPDAGRHVSPDAVTINTISASSTTLSWTTSNATSCAWIRKDDLIPHGVSAATTSATHGAGTGVAIVLICSGNEGEPAVAGALVP